MPAYALGQVAASISNQVMEIILLKRAADQATTPKMTKEANVKTSATVGGTTKEVISVQTT